MAAPPVPTAVPPSIGLAHRRRLREVWRSAGWPCQDLLEVELLAAGLLERLRDGHGRETLRVTDAGVQMLQATLQKNRAARDAHEALVACVAREMQRNGRIVWRGLRLRAPPGPAGNGKWTLAMPDVFSIRHTTREDHVEPVVHEIKVRRADLLSDLRHEAKRAAYLGVASQCWYVLAAGIGRPEEIPPDHGVLIAHGTALELARAAPHRPMRVPLHVWMALARASAEPPLDEDAQAWLGGEP